MGASRTEPWWCSFAVKPWCTLGENHWCTYGRKLTDPTLGRFLSADTVQPNAPGTQGYNLYAYTANNPTTWTDLSGNSVSGAVLGAAVLLGRACLFFSWCRGPLVDGVRRIAVGSNAGDWRVVAGGFSESVFAIAACALDGACWNLAFVLNDLLLRYGGGADTGGGTRPPAPASCIVDASGRQHLLNRAIPHEDNPLLSENSPRLRGDQEVEVRPPHLPAVGFHGLCLRIAETRVDRPLAEPRR